MAITKGILTLILFFGIYWGAAWVIACGGCSTTPTPSITRTNPELQRYEVICSKAEHYMKEC